MGREVLFLGAKKPMQILRVCVFGEVDCSALDMLPGYPRVTPLWMVRVAMLFMAVLSLCALLVRHSIGAALLPTPDVFCTMLIWR